MQIVLKKHLNEEQLSKKINNKAFLAMQQKDENLAISILRDKKFNICELIEYQGEQQNLLSIAVYFQLNRVVEYLLNDERFQKVINEGNNPYYNFLSTYNKEISQYNIDTKKTIFEELLNSDKVELPEGFPILLQKELDSRIVFENNQIEHNLFLKESIMNVLKSNKFEKHINTIFNPYDTYLMFFIKNKNYDAADIILNNKQFNKLNYDYIHNWLFHHINAATACFKGTGDVGFIGKNTIIEEDYLYKILLDDRFDIDLVFNVLLTLLIYYGKHHERKDYTNCSQVQTILLKVIDEKKFPKKEENYYDELVFASSLYGNVDVLNLLMQKQNIIISPYTQSLVVDYGIELYDIPKKEQVKLMFENSVDKLNTVEILARHILVYGTCLYGNQYGTKLSNLEEIALKNITKYFEDDEKVKNVLSNMKTKIPYVSVYNKKIAHKKENFMDCNEYELYRCYYPDEETFIEQLEKCKLIAKSLVDSFQLIQKNKILIKK